VKKDYFRSVLLPLIIIPVGGLLTLGACYLLYYFVYNFVESRFFPTDPTSVPADIIRRAYAVSLLVLYLVLLRTKVSDLFRATILVGPVAMVVTTAILALYEKPALAMVAIVVIVAVCVFLLYRYKKPWVYYYAIAATVLAAIALAWPEP
jgi:hypothetical protein